MIRFHEWMKLKEGGVYDPLQRLAKTGDEIYDSEEDMDYHTKAGDRNDAIDDPKDDPHKGQLARSGNDPRLRYPRVQQSGKTPGRGMQIKTPQQMFGRKRRRDVE